MSKNSGLEVLHIVSDNKLCKTKITKDMFVQLVYYSLCFRIIFDGQ